MAYLFLCSVKSRKGSNAKYSCSSVGHCSLLHLYMLIKELTLLTNEISATKDFYHGLMEFPLVQETATAVSFKTGNSILHFRLAAKDDSPFYHIAFSIPNNKLQEALHWVSKRTNILPYTETELIADFTGWNAKAFYFHDNRQNILEFITHFDLHTNQNDPFSSNAVERICEAGVVVDDVSAACKNINSIYNIPYFVKGPFMKDFAVMGDSEGLLIISKTHRGWLPTQRPSEKFPLNIIVENNHEVKELFF